MPLTDEDGAILGYFAVKRVKVKKKYPRTLLVQVEMDKAIAKLKKEMGSDLKGYVIDLRNNPGGLLDQAISVTDAAPRASRYRSSANQLVSRGNSRPT